ncbi:MAG: VOC family protein [Planctomycetes bacterium]|nr:VOC family protein [Planctomycetota bacterium]
MKITGVDHVQIAVPPELEEAALAFYVGVLGLKRLPKPEGTGDTRGAWLGAGNLQVHIGIQQDFTPAKKAHVGFLVDDLAATEAALNAAGAPIKAASDLCGLKRLFTEDPAGNRLEFLQNA